MIITKNNLLFIHIPKCMGTSVKHALKNDIKNDNKYSDLMSGHPKWNEILDRIGNKEWDNCFKFTIVRNPMESYQSWYRFVKKTFPSTAPNKQLVDRYDINTLIDVIKEKSIYIAVLNQSDFIYNSNTNALMVDRVFKMCEINEINTFFVDRGYKLPHMNSVSEGLNPSYKKGFFFDTEITTDTKNKIIDICERDYRLLNF